MSISSQIARYALELGFTSCGIVPLSAVDDLTRFRYLERMEQGSFGDMSYLRDQAVQRFDPRCLLEGARSLVCVTLNYFPVAFQPEHLPQIASYAYGRDYHKVVRNKLRRLLAFVQTLLPLAKGRCLVDSAPLLEKYWASRAGLGFIGKNGLLIDPRRGSFLLLGELMLDCDLESFSTETFKAVQCGTCTRCLTACPTHALSPYRLNACVCLSYLTVESGRDDGVNHFSNSLFGCDRCQRCCPWNRWAQPTGECDLHPRPFVYFDYADWDSLQENSFNDLTAGSSLRRMGFATMKNNVSKVLSGEKEVLKGDR